MIGLIIKFFKGIITTTPVIGILVLPLLLITHDYDKKINNCNDIDSDQTNTNFNPSDDNNGNSNKK